MNIQYTDTQLEQALAKMLPELLECPPQDNYALCWKSSALVVRDTELLHLCWMMEEELLIKSDDGCWSAYVQLFKRDYYGSVLHATWQQRVTALCKVKGIEL